MASTPPGSQPDAPSTPTSSTIVQSGPYRGLDTARHQGTATREGLRLATSDARLATLSADARRVIAGLSDRDRAMMLMRGTFGGHPRTLISVARSFRVNRHYVRRLEAEVFRMLGPDWSAKYRQARRHSPFRAPYERERDHAFCLHGPGHRSTPEGRERRPACNTRSKGSRRSTKSGADPPGEHPRIASPPLSGPVFAARFGGVA
jgi:hypothetical protein